MKYYLLLSVLPFFFSCSTAQKKIKEEKEPENKTEETVKITTNNEKKMNLYDFKVTDINGNEFDMSTLKGKKVMIVNVASECGYTPQYEQLQEVYEKYGGDKFEIIGFPANNFGGQEPGSDSTIAAFCKKNYGVTFKMMSKISVVGDDQHEIYQWLTQKAKNGVEDATVEWNFHKFLIDENGNYYMSLPTKMLPNDKEVLEWIGGK